MHSPKRPKNTSVLHYIKLKEQNKKIIPRKGLCKAVTAPPLEDLSWWFEHPGVISTGTCHTASSSTAFYGASENTPGPMAEVSCSPVMPWHNHFLAAEADPEVPSSLRRQRIQGWNLIRVFLPAKRNQVPCFLSVILYAANIP